MDEQVEVDTCLALAWAYDTQDLRVPWDWKGQQQQRTMVSKQQQQGAVYESEFRTECLRRGFEPHDPTVPQAWDFIVLCPAGTLRVQVKGTEHRSEYGSYKLTTSSGFRVKKVIDRNKVDVVVCYIDPEKTWYVISNDKPLPKTVKLMAGNKRSASKYEKYRDNWSPFYEKQQEKE